MSDSVDLAEMIAEGSEYTPDEIRELAADCDVQDLRDARVEKVDSSADE